MFGFLPHFQAAAGGEGPDPFAKLERGAGQLNEGPDPFAKLERGAGQLNSLTIEERINEKRHENALARWKQITEDWERFRGMAAKKTKRGKEELCITAAEEYRERCELMELIDHVTPDFIKSGGYGWYQSLRDYGARLVTVGNLFSALYLFIRIHKDYSEELIRKPWLAELSKFRKV